MNFDGRFTRPLFFAHRVLWSLAVIYPRWLCVARRSCCVSRLWFPAHGPSRVIPRPLRTGAAKGGTRVVFGDYGIQALEPAYVTNRQIESARIAMNRHIRRGGKVWITIFPDQALTKKPAETRMGSGKGSPEWWVANIKPGRILFEMSFPNEATAREAMRRAMHKLPMKCRFISREAGEF